MSLSREEIAQCLRDCKTAHPNLGQKALAAVQRLAVIQCLKDNKNRLGGVNPANQPVQSQTTGWLAADAILEDLESYPDYAGS